MAGWDPLNMTMATRRRATTSKQSRHFKHKNDQTCTETAQGTAFEFLSFDWQPFPQSSAWQIETQRTLFEDAAKQCQSLREWFSPAFFIFDYLTIFHIFIREWWQLWYMEGFQCLEPGKPWIWSCFVRSFWLKTSLRARHSPSGHQAIRPGSTLLGKPIFPQIGAAEPRGRLQIFNWEVLLQSQELMARGRSGRVFAISFWNFWRILDDPGIIWYHLIIGSPGLGSALCLVAAALFTKSLWMPTFVQARQHKKKASRMAQDLSMYWSIDQYFLNYFSIVYIYGKW